MAHNSTVHADIVSATQVTEMTAHPNSLARVAKGKLELSTVCTIGLIALLLGNELSFLALALDALIEMMIPMPFVVALVLRATLAALAIGALILAMRVMLRPQELREPSDGGLE